MADLEDFFAKKDKKKKKTSKAGFSKANTDVIAKNLEVQRHKDQEKEFEQAEPLATTIGNQDSHESTSKLFNPEAKPREGEDEWYDYDPEEKDYSGLKIEALNIQEDIHHTHDEEASDGQHDVSEEAGGKKDSGSTVWKGSGPSDEPEVSNKAAPVSTGSKAYICPEKKRAMDLAKPKRFRAAPDIKSEIYFPSLSSSVIPCEDDSRRDKFEEVRGGGSSSHNHKSEAPRLTLDNKFSALRE